MRGDSWDGKPIDTTAAMQPIVEAILAKQKELGLSQRQVSHITGRTQSWLGELLGNMDNPRLGRLCLWAQAVQVQEFGIFLVLGEEHMSLPLFDIDEPPPWTINENGRQIPDFRQALKPLLQLLRRRRREVARSVDEYARDYRVSRSVLATLESGARTRSPTAGYLMNWAKSLGAETFGIYVVIDGAYTETDLLGDDHG